MQNPVSRDFKKCTKCDSYTIEHHMQKLMINENNIEQKCKVRQNQTIIWIDTSVDGFAKFFGSD